jgi:hypothetical protein
MEYKDIPFCNTLQNNFRNTALGIIGVQGGGGR